MSTTLTARGYRVYENGPWMRGERASGLPRIVDVALDAIVDLATFARYVIASTSIVRRSEAGGPPLPVPPLEDLVAQKLIACREKDALDIVFVALEGASIDGNAFARAIARNDVGVAVRRGALEVDAAAQSGRLAELWQERVGEVLSEADVARVRRSLASWLGNGGAP